MQIRFLSAIGLYIFIFYRASIWWKYLDGESVLPPPFTIFYLTQKLLQMIYEKLMELCFPKCAKFQHGENADVESPTVQKKREQERRLAIDKSIFEKRYTHLMLMLISAPEKDRFSS